MDFSPGSQFLPLSALSNTQSEDITMEIAPRLLGNSYRRKRNKIIMPDSKIITLHRHRERESFLLVDLMSSVSMEKVRGFVEESAKTMFSNDNVTINLWPFLITGFILLLGRPGRERRLALNVTFSTAGHPLHHLLPLRPLPLHVQDRQ